MLIQMLSKIMGLNAHRILAKYPTKTATPMLSCIIILLHSPTSSSSFIVLNSSGYRQKWSLFSTSTSVKGTTTNSNIKNNNPNMLSESTNNDPKSMKKITKDNVITNNLAAVNRNTQSLVFKNSSPLAFYDDVSHAIENNLNIDVVANSGLK